MKINESSPSESFGRRVALDGVWKEYQNFVAVRDVSFTLQPGEFLTLLGPSGSGKTSTLMMVAGFEAPTRGAIRVDGIDVAHRTPKERNFGVVFQGYALFPHMTALENAEFPLRMRGFKPRDRRKLALDMLDKVGLGEFTNRRPRELSGGQQQRIALARALVFQPDALLLDEPLGALDKNMRERMQDEIKDLQRRIGVSILFVTHDQSEAMQMSDRIAVMDAGRIIQIGSPREIYYRPQTPFVASFFGETNLVPCKILGVSCDRMTVSLHGGGIGPALRPESVPTNTLSIIDKEALISVRPECIRVLSGPDTADFTLEARVSDCTFLGRHSRIIAHVQDQRYAILTTDQQFARSVTPGGQIRFGWMGGDAQVLLREER